MNANFKVTRCSENAPQEFTFADLPNLSPHDWILLPNLQLTEEQKYEPILAHIKRMLVSYIYEVEKLDIKIAKVLKRKPIVNPIRKSCDINEMSMGKIETIYLTVMFQHGTDVPGAFQKGLFTLPGKHLFSTTCLEHILEIINKCSLKDSTAKKKFDDMIRWYILFRITFLAVIPNLFKTIKKTQHQCISRLN